MGLRNNDFCQLGLAVIETEAQAVSGLSARIDEHFVNACELLLACQGRIIVMGMGKSGHIGRKIAATLASTGSPAFFVHPAEANHGDLGMITKDDVLITISNSGTNTELLTLLPLMKRLGVNMLTLTGNTSSPLAQYADVVLDVGVTVEACPLGLAPTTSTTVTLVMGDALAVALLKAKGFTTDDFARSHPGGRLGRQLLLQVDTLCHQGELLPLIEQSATISEALIEITNKKLGMTTIIDQQGQLAGVFTDGDVRRALTSQQLNIHTTPVSEVMTTDCQTISSQLLAQEALRIMQDKKITTLVIIDENKRPTGVVHMHELIKAGVQ